MLHMRFTVQTCLHDIIQTSAPALTRAELALLTWPGAGPARQMLLDRLAGTADGTLAAQVAQAADDLHVRDREQLAQLRRAHGLVTEAPWSGLALSAVALVASSAA